MNNLFRHCRLASDNLFFLFLPDFDRVSVDWRWKQMGLQNVDGCALCKKIHLPLKGRTTLVQSFLGYTPTYFSLSVSFNSRLLP